MSTFEKRLKDLEIAEAEEATARLAALSDDELNALIEGYKREDPEAWARLEAMTDAELRAVAEGRYA